MRSFRNSQSEIRNSSMVGEDRIELSPRVPKTRMLALHHTPKIGVSTGSGSDRVLRFRLMLIDSLKPSEVETTTRSLPLPVLASALHAAHLFDLSDNFDQVFLFLHQR